MSRKGEKEGVENVGMKEDWNDDKVRDEKGKGSEEINFHQYLYGNSITTLLFRVYLPY